MIDFDSDQTFDVFRDDLVSYLAQKLGVPNDVALETLGDWLVRFQPQHAAVQRAVVPPPPEDDDLGDE